MKKIASLAVSLTVLSVAQGQIVISEFEPNPAGGDPPTVTIELSGGISGAAFDLWFISIENDGLNGTIDRSTNITGTFDANGLGTASIGDLENPSFTVALIDTADMIATGTDIDPADDGNLVIPGTWTVLDAIGVSDSTGDDATLYGEMLGGSNVLFNGEFEPLLVFRDGMTGDLFQTVTVDFGTPEQRIAAYSAAGGTELTPAQFSGDITTTSFGAVNPIFVPEPGTAAFLGLAGLFGIMRRRR